MESNTYLREGVNVCWKRAWLNSLSPLPNPNGPQLWKKFASNSELSWPQLLKIVGTKPPGPNALSV